MKKYVGRNDRKYNRNKYKPVKSMGWEVLPSGAIVIPKNKK